MSVRRSSSMRMLMVRVRAAVEVAAMVCSLSDAHVETSMSQL
jgi:hypothetical protein